MAQGGDGICYILLLLINPYVMMLFAIQKALTKKRLLFNYAVTIRLKAFRHLT